MSRKITLLVRDGAKVVDGPLIDRPVRKLASGVAAAVYLGSVYPLYPGDFIDLRDKPLDKSACPGFVGVNERIVYQPPPQPKATAVGGQFVPKRWYVETNRFGHYVVFDGTEKQADEIAHRLEASPLGLVRWGESTRPADDGHHYDWFARLEFDGSRDDCIAQVVALVGGSQPAKKSKPPAKSKPESAPIPSPRHAATVATSADEALLAARVRAERAEAEVARLAAAADNRERAYRELMDRVDAVNAHLEPIAERLREHEQVVTERDALRHELSVAQQAQLRLAAERDASTNAAHEAHRRSQQRLRAAQADVLAERAQRDQLEAELAALRSQLEQQLTDAGVAADAQAHIERLEADLANAQRRQVDAQERVAELERLFDEEMVPRDELRQEHEQLEYAIEDNTRLEQALVDAENRTAMLQCELDELRQELDDRRRRGGGVPSAGQRLDEVLRDVFPHLYIGGDSIDEIEREFPDPTALFDLLKRLDLKLDVPLKATSEAGVKEVDDHIATGSPECSGLGRVYTRALPDGRLWVLVHRKHDKKEQSQVIAKFSRRPLPVAPAA